MAKIIVIDGLDGSGKATQSAIVEKKLKDLGYNVVKASFPNYNSESSAAVRMYLNGELGTDAKKLNPFMCSAFYAVDRAIQFCQTLREEYEKDNNIILLDRYLSANIIHQGGKFKSDDKMKDFFLWDYKFETEYLGIPKDDITIVLEVPVNVSQKLMTKRYNGNEEKKDIHEADVEYLNLCYHSMEVACNTLPSEGHNWVRVSCSNDGENIRDIEDINKEIMGHILRVLDN